MALSKRGMAVFMVSIDFISAELNVAVHLDATYAIDPIRGVEVCGGVGNLPTGDACPLKGDVAIANCSSDLKTYNGTECVAPVDAKCVIDAKSTWSCVFPGGDDEVEDLSSTLTISSDTVSMESPWGDLPWRAPPPVASVRRVKISEEVQVD